MCVCAWFWEFRAKAVASRDIESKRAHLEIQKFRLLAHARHRMRSRPHFASGPGSFPLLRACIREWNISWCVFRTFRIVPGRRCSRLVEDLLSQYTARYGGDNIDGLRRRSTLRRGRPGLRASDQHSGQYHCCSTFDQQQCYWEWVHSKIFNRSRV